MTTWKSRAADVAKCGQIVFGLSVLLSVSGCRMGTPSCCPVSDQIQSRFGANVADARSVQSISIPPGVELNDGVSEDEAVQTALWNNAVFQETLSQLGLSQAQLFDAGLIADPQFSIFFPLGPKQLEFTTFQAIDAIWIQPIRIKAAELNVNQVNQTIVQNGLNVIRDARVAHANLVAAVEQAAVASEAARLRDQIAQLAQRRLDAGDISQLEFTTSRIDALQAKASAGRAKHQVTLALAQLRTVMGLAVAEAPALTLQPEETLEVDLGRVASADVESTAAFVNEALVMRPDLRAAEIAVEAAGERSGLARRQFMNLDVIYDANGKGQRGSYESGPGLRFTIPIFNKNQGGIAIANAQWDQAIRRYVSVRDQVTLDVRTAYIQLVQAAENLDDIQESILPALREAEELARKNYENGATPYFLVLQTTGQYLDARLRESQLQADVRIALANLDRSVGRRVSAELRQEKLPPSAIPAVEESPKFDIAVIVNATAAKRSDDENRGVIQTSAEVRRPVVQPGWRATDSL